MKKIGVVLFVLFVASAAFADETRRGWHLNAQFIQMSVRGYAGHLGDTYTFTQNDLQPGNIQQETLYGVSYQPIDVRPPSDFAPRLEVYWQGVENGFGADFWMWESSNSLSGVQTSPPPELSVGLPGSGVPNSYLVTVNGVWMWRQFILPATNQENPSGFSDVSWRAESDFSVSAGDLYWRRPLTRNLALIAGGRYARVRDRIGNGLLMDSFIISYFWPSSPELDWYNDISISMDAESSFRGMGPMVGLRASAGKGILKLRASLLQSTTFGTVRYRGRWQDKDKITIVNRLTGKPVHENHLNGALEFNRNESVAVSNTEGTLEVGMELPCGLGVGVAAFWSVWNDVPMAPRWEMPAGWSISESSAWATPRATLSFKGAVFSIRASF